MSIRKRGKQPIWLWTVAVAALALGSGCIKSSGSDGANAAGDGSGSGSGGGAAANETIVSTSVSGVVSTDIIDSSGTSTSALSLRGVSKSSRANTCASGTFAIYPMGHGEEPAAEGTVAADGSFTLEFDVTVKDETAAADEAATDEATTDEAATDGATGTEVAAMEADGEPELGEVMLVFTCGEAEQRCYGSLGDENFACDPLINAIILALETALGEPVHTSQLYAGIRVATLAQGMVEVLRLECSITDGAFCSDLVNATSIEDLVALVMDSTVGAMISSLEAVFREVKAINENEGTELTNAQRQEIFSAVWDVETLLQAVTGVGMDVCLRLDDREFIDGDLATMIDNITGGTFLADFATHLKKQNNISCGSENGEANGMAFRCIARDYENWQRKPQQYCPELATDADGVEYLTCLGSHAADKLGIVTSDGHVADGWEVEAKIFARKIEIDRNDPEGLYGDKDEIRSCIGTVDIFEEFEAVMENECSNFITEGDDGPGPDTNWEAFGECIREHGAEDYFSGLLGVHRFLTNPDLKDLRISMRDLHGAMVDNLQLRISGESPEFGSHWVGARITDATGDRGDWVHVPQLLVESDEADENGIILHQYFPEALFNGFEPDFDAEITTAQYNAIIAATLPSFDMLWGDFLEIPKFKEIQNTIVTSSHHEPRNTSGERNFRSIAADIDADGMPDVPVLCEFRNADGTARKKFVEGETSLHCAKANGTWTGGAAAAGDDIGFTKPYALVFWGPAPDGGAFAGLQDMVTGHFYYGDGIEFRVRLVAADAAGSSTPTKEVNEFCHSFIDDEGDQTADCWVEEFISVSIPLPSTAFSTATFRPMVWEHMIFLEQDTAHDGSAGTEADFNGGQFDPYQDNMEFIFLGATNGLDIGSDSNHFDWGNVFPVCLNSDGITLDSTDDKIITAVALTDNVESCWDNLHFDGPAFEEGCNPDNGDDCGENNVSGGPGGNTVGCDPQTDPLCDGFCDTAEANDPDCGAGDPGAGGCDPQTDPLCDGFCDTAEANDPDCGAGDPAAGNPPAAGPEAGGDDASCYRYYLAHFGGDSKDTFKYEILREDFCFGGWDKMNDAAGDAYLVLLNDVETALGKQLTDPWEPDFFVQDMEIKNPGYDSLFDPYCDDLDNSGFCDCLRDVNGNNLHDTALNGTTTPTDAACNLDDIKGSEPTFSEAPVHPGDHDSGKFWGLMGACGGKGAAELQTCLAAEAADGLDISNLSIDSHRIFECYDDDLTDTLSAREMHWVDIHRVADPETYAFAGGNCGGSNVEGMVRMRNITARNNAFDIGRPQSLVSKVSAATASIGTGITLDPDEPAFNLMEAIAMGYVRVAFPLRNTVKGPNFFDIRPDEEGNFVLNSEGGLVEQPGFRVDFRTLENFDKHVDPMGAVLRKFLEVGGKLQAAE